jgi:hypothetical protein
MAHKRTEFTENQKAEIFVRDRATCAFSCVSLWLLDYGIRPNRQIDWVDHLRPSVSGGKADLDNGICVSHTFNAKKRGNASDNICFVKHGEITKDYIWMFGCPTQNLLAQLKRLKHLEVSDWYFNKCIDNIFEGLTWRCEVEFKDVRYKRDDMYWFGSGWKRLTKFQKKKGRSIKERGLIMTPNPFGSELLLELEEIYEAEDYAQWIERIYPVFRANYRLLHLFFTLNDEDAKQGLIQEARLDNRVHPEVLSALTLLSGQYV